MTLLRTVAAGAAAGAAGTTALNAVTYLDMAVRARPSSSTPQQTVEKAAQRAGVSIPGEGEQRENRLSGLGPLSGLATGVGVATLGGPLLAKLPLPRLLKAAALGAVAMAASDGSMAALGVTDPREWSPSAWAADVVPHLAYGAVAMGVLALALGGRRR